MREAERRHRPHGPIAYGLPELPSYSFPLCSLLPLPLISMFLSFLPSSYFFLNEGQNALSRYASYNDGSNDLWLTHLSKIRTQPKCIIHVCILSNFHFNWDEITVRLIKYPWVYLINLIMGMSLARVNFVQRIYMRTLSLSNLHF